MGIYFANQSPDGIFCACGAIAHGIPGIPDGWCIGCEDWAMETEAGRPLGEGLVRYWDSESGLWGRWQKISDPCPFPPPSLASAASATSVTDSQEAR